MGRRITRKARVISIQHAPGQHEESSQNVDCSCTSHKIKRTSARCTPKLAERSAESHGRLESLTFASASRSTLHISRNAVFPYGTSAIGQSQSPHITCSPRASATFNESPDMVSCSGVAGEERTSRGNFMDCTFAVRVRVLTSSWEHWPSPPGLSPPFTHASHCARAARSRTPNASRIYGSPEAFSHAK